MIKIMKGSPSDSELMAAEMAEELPVRECRSECDCDTAWNNDGSGKACDFAGRGDASNSRIMYELNLQFGGF